MLVTSILYTHLRGAGRVIALLCLNALYFPVDAIGAYCLLPEDDPLSIYEVTVEAGFSLGHYLRNYPGKCENPHGHNYKVRITLVSKELDVTGLLPDFKHLTRVIWPIVDNLDHQTINDQPAFTTTNPSAENLARCFFDETENRCDR